MASMQGAAVHCALLCCIAYENVVVKSVRAAKPCLQAYVRWVGLSQAAKPGCAAGKASAWHCFGVAAGLSMCRLAQGTGHRAWRWHHTCTSALC